MILLLTFPSWSFSMVAGPLKYPLGLLRLHLINKTLVPLLTEIVDKSDKEHQLRKLGLLGFLAVVVRHCP